MKYCPYCGAPAIDSAASFCSECGGKQQKNRNDFYDGYYDDVKPLDGGNTREPGNMELVKRVSAIASCALAVIFFLLILILYVL